MPEFLDMGKYAVYVWSSVALFFFLVGWDILSLRRKQRHLCRQLLSMQRRRQQRGGHKSGNPDRTDRSHD